MTFHQEFQSLAKIKNKITYKLLALLPKIFESGEYKKYAYTIQGYAYRYAQIPESTVNKVLNLDKKLNDRPLLKQAIEDVGVHKIAAVESLVTVENEAIFVEKIKHMSKSALNELSKELRKTDTYKTVTISLSADLQKLWDTAKKLLECTESSDLDFINRLLEAIIVSKSAELNCEKKEATRHIPAKSKRDLLKKYSNKCAYPNCHQTAEHIHHQERYAESKNHKKIVPLCKIHHEFAHNSLIQNELEYPEKWKLQLVKTTNLTDIKYQRFRC